MSPAPVSAEPAWECPSDSLPLLASLPVSQITTKKKRSCSLEQNVLSCVALPSIPVGTAVPRIHSTPGPERVGEELDSSRVASPPVVSHLSSFPGPASVRVTCPSSLQLTVSSVKHLKCLLTSNRFHTSEPKLLPQESVVSPVLLGFSSGAASWSPVHHPVVGAYEAEECDLQHDFQRTDFL